LFNVQTKPLFTSQSFSVLSSPPPDSAVLPSGEKATEVTQLECPSNLRISHPVCASQSFSHLSLLPDSTLLLSGEKATERTTPASLNARISPVAKSQSLSPSPPPDSAVLPSGAKATAAGQLEKAATDFQVLGRVDVAGNGHREIRVKGRGADDGVLLVLSVFLDPLAHILK
jgi:hypothetical protein